MGDQQCQVLVGKGFAVLGLLCRQLRAPRLKAVQLPAQLVDPRAAGRLRHRALLEGAEVAVERLADLAGLGVDPGDLLFPLRTLGLKLLEGGGDRLLHHGLLLEDREKLTEDRLLQLAGR
ncbi:MAG TPA: hypothetical protein VGH14_17115 [Solirubrobacterales bacterium]